MQVIGHTVIGIYGSAIADNNKSFKKWNLSLNAVAHSGKPICQKLSETMTGAVIVVPALKCRSRLDHEDKELWL